LSFDFAGDQAKIGDEIYSLSSGLKKEAAAVLNSAGALVYTIETLDKRSLSIMLDNKGALSTVSFTGRTGTPLGCVAQ
jgi:hypothetical protein